MKKTLFSSAFLFVNALIMLFFISLPSLNAAPPDKLAYIFPPKDTSRTVIFLKQYVEPLYNRNLDGDHRSLAGTVNYIPKFTSATDIGNSIIYDNGSAIGIGTTSPGYTLDVKGTTRIGGTASGLGNALEIWNLGSNIFSFNNSGAMDLVATGLRIGTGTIGGLGSNPIVSKLDDTKYLSLANALYVAPNSKNILINTITDNGYKLDAVGSVRFGHYVGNSRRSMTFNADAAVEDALLISTPTAAGATSTGVRYAPLNANSGRHKGFVVSFPTITFSNSENVGFEIDATVGATATITGVKSVVARAASSSARTCYAGYFSAVADMGPAYALYSAAGLNYFAGNVGLGVASPAARLHVSGAVRLEGLTVSNSHTRLLVTDNNGNLGYREVTGVTGTFSGTASYLAKYASSSEIVNSLLYDNGTGVGIGTTNPGPYKLAVEGSIGARKVKVTQVTPWADYVFEADYKLRSLKELEEYIAANKHLPEVPTTSDVEKNGLDLGDMQATLLKKIEELTLYTIAQQKEIEALKSQRRETAILEERIEKLEQLIKLNKM